MSDLESDTELENVVDPTTDKIKEDTDNDDDSETDMELGEDDEESDDEMFNPDDINETVAPDNDYSNLNLNIDNTLILNDNLNKFQNNFKDNYIKDTHTECLYISNQDLSKFTKTIRNNNGIIVDNLHRTIPILTKYEQTKILGLRTKQLNTGSKPYLSGYENIKNNYLLAKEELNKKALPFIIKRPIPNGTFEYWKLSDLEIL
jgi:DNA-directed RNA polymerase I, II, and III subunit RPABC2